MALIHFNEEGFDRALESNALMLVDFWATWCGPCRMLGPVIEQIAEDYEDKDVVIGKVDVDQNMELAHRYGIMGVPTVLLLKGEEEIQRFVGVQSADVYTDAIDGNL